MTPRWWLSASNPNKFHTLECASFFATSTICAMTTRSSSLSQNFLLFLWQSGWLISVWATPPCSFNTCRKRAVSGCYGNVVWLTAERWVREMSLRICGQLDMRLHRCMNQIAIFRWLIVHLYTRKLPLKGFILRKWYFDDIHMLCLHFLFWVCYFDLRTKNYMKIFIQIDV